MPKLLSLVVVTALALPGCVVHSYDRSDDPEVVYVVENYAPEVIDADAGVFYDARERDDIWYFDAAVDDPDHVSDVVAVWADVYDENVGVLVESFELLPSADPYIWYGEYLGRTTVLDPFYPAYTVDIVAYDSFDAYDAITIWADTY